MIMTNLPVRVLNIICDFLLYLAAGGVAILIGAYLYEIVARYVFEAPTTWANEVVAIVLSLSIFFAMPKVAAEGGHVAITLLQDAMPVRSAAILKSSLLIVGALTCLTVAGIAGTVATRQFASGMMTMGNHPIPKSILTSSIALGFGLSGLQYLQRVFCDAIAGWAR